jgi:hypothetical protein
MDVTKKYFKNFWVVFSAITPIIVFLSEKYDFSMINSICFQGNSIISQYLQVISFCAFIVLVGEILSVWIVLLMVAVVIDLIILPVKIIIRKRKNRIQVIKNPFYD